MISNYFILIFQKLKFFYQVGKNAIIIFFRKNREIELLKLEYSNRHIFDNGYLIIRYRFKNALYYQFDKIATTENQIKIFDTSNFKNEFDLVVHGLYTRKTYSIKTTPENTIQTNSFITAFNNLKSDIEFHAVPKLSVDRLEVQKLIPTYQTNKIAFIINHPRIKEQTVTIQNHPFNEFEFI